MSKIKIILIGTSEFAAHIFEHIFDKINIIAVITTPDKPAGRKQILTLSPVKIWAEKNNLPVFSQIEKIKQLKPDLVIVTAYGQIIPKQILDIPKYGALNIHPSLLPKYRGASPIQATILNGDKETGVTIILMDEKMDHGNIVAKSKVKNHAYRQAGQKSKVTYEELSNQLADVAANLLIKTLPNWVAGEIKAKLQDHSKATFTKIIKKEDGKIDWNKSAEEIERQIRAFHQWPTAYTFWNDKQLKILEANCTSLNDVHKKIGEVFLSDNKQLAIQTRNGILIPEQVQLEGKKPMTAKDFLNGHPEIIGTILK